MKLSANIVIADRYQLVECLGAGAMGEVWRAQDTRFEARAVAVKFLREDESLKEDTLARDRLQIRADHQAARGGLTVDTALDALGTALAGSSLEGLRAKLAARVGTAAVRPADVMAVFDELVNEPSFNENARMRAKLRRLFRDEANSVANLRHDNIVSIFDYGDQSGTPYLVMDYIEGRTLYQVIQARESLRRSRRLQLIEDLCAGLGHAHRKKLVHRDIKPANLIIDSSTNSLKILDFGVVRRLGSASTIGVPVGTFCYMSPEQTRGAATLDHRSDIFAVGLVFYELLSGQKAFPPGKSLGDLVARIQRNAPPPLRDLVPGIPRPIEDIISTALEKQPENRYQDLTAMEREIARIRTKIEAEEQSEQTMIASMAEPTVLKAPAAKPASEEWLDRAELAFQKGDDSSALELCEKILGLNPGSAAALALKNRVEVRQRGDKVRELVQQAEKFLALEDLDSARADVTRAKAIDPKASSVRSFEEKLNAAVAARTAARERAQRAREREEEQERARLEREQARERQERERALEQERQAREQQAREQRAREQQAREQQAREQQAREQHEREQQERERELERQQQEREKAQERERERARQQREREHARERERLEREREEQERSAREQKEREQAEQRERDRLERERAQEQERLAREQKEREQAEQREQERLRKEREQEEELLRQAREQELERQRAEREKVLAREREEKARLPEEPPVDGPTMTLSREQVMRGVIPTVPKLRPGPPLSRAPSPPPGAAPPAPPSAQATSRVAVPTSGPPPPATVKSGDHAPDEPPAKPPVDSGPPPVPPPPSRPPGPPPRASRPSSKSRSSAARQAPSTEATIVSRRNLAPGAASAPPPPAPPTPGGLGAVPAARAVTPGVGGRTLAVMGGGALLILLALGAYLTFGRGATTQPAPEPIPAAEQPAPPPPDPAPALPPEPAEPEVVVPAGAPTPVTIDIRPWARVKIVAAKEGMTVPAEPQYAPFTVELAAGDYVLECENGGLTRPSSFKVTITEGKAQFIVRTMPGFNATKAVDAILSQGK
ncbi:MAG: protein kinase domain-containing protein [Acidobacteriota bacterium]